MFWFWPQFQRKIYLVFRGGVDEVRDRYLLRIFFWRLHFSDLYKWKRRKAIKPIFHYVSLKWCPRVKGWRDGEGGKKAKLASGHSHVNANKVIWRLHAVLGPKHKNKDHCIFGGLMNVVLPIYLFFLLITISWYHNRIVNYQGVTA